MGKLILVVLGLSLLACNQADRQGTEEKKKPLVKAAVKKKTLRRPVVIDALEEIDGTDRKRPRVPIPAITGNEEQVAELAAVHEGIEPQKLTIAFRYNNVSFGPLEAEVHDYYREGEGYYFLIDIAGKLQEINAKNIETGKLKSSELAKIKKFCSQCRALDADMIEAKEELAEQRKERIERSKAAQRERLAAAAKAQEEREKAIRENEARLAMEEAERAAQIRYRRDQFRRQQQAREREAQRRKDAAHERRTAK